MKHKHAELIKAWADGAEIEYKNDGGWVSLGSYSIDWNCDRELRIKPEPIEIEITFKVKVTTHKVQSFVDSFRDISDSYMRITYDIVKDRGLADEGKLMMRRTER